jgi:mannose-6-phosphate isomerase class I
MIFKLEPLFFDKVWGGNKIRNNYHYNCSDHTGEAWGISAHKNGSSVIVNGVYKGKTLRELYASNKELFGYYKNDEFPILIKIIDATDDLSIQVHPTDEYARIYENSSGKTECWYILDAEKDASIVIGHHAKTLDEIKKSIQGNTIESLLNKFPIKKGDQFNIYSGTIHAICKGTLLLEIQQSSDITYRLYDYNRLSNGKLRKLHIEKALDVIKIPDNKLSQIQPKDLFDYRIVQSTNKTIKTSNSYGDYIFILNGKGSFNNLDVKKGDFIFASANTEYNITGDIEYFLASIK